MKESLIIASKFLSQDTKQIFLIKRRTVLRSILHTLVAELHYNRKRYEVLAMGAGGMRGRRGGKWGSLETVHGTHYSEMPSAPQTTKCNNSLLISHDDALPL